MARAWSADPTQTSCRATIGGKIGIRHQPFACQRRDSNPRRSPFQVPICPNSTTIPLVALFDAFSDTQIRLPAGPIIDFTGNKAPL